MPEIEYIERDDALIVINHSVIYSSFDRQDAIDNLKSIPAADVVSVVRCKECKYYDPPSDSEEDCGRCMNWDMPVCGDDATTFNPDPDFFCPFGLAE